MDGIVAAVYFLLALGPFVLAAIEEVWDHPLQVVFDWFVLTTSTVAVLLRRRAPTLMMTLVLSLGFFEMFHEASADVLSLPILLFSVAVYRSVRLSIVFASIAILFAFALPLLPWNDSDPVLAFMITTTSLVGVLTGTISAGRRQHVAALVERSSQLEREQQFLAQIAAAEERARIAREMHDIVSHSLTVVVTLADGAVTTKDDVAARKAIAAVAKSGREALANLRQLLGVLRTNDPVPLTPAAEPASLPELLSQFVALGLPASLTVLGTSPKSPLIQLTIHRTVKEGLTNALRYSDPPRSATVTVHHAQAGTTVTVSNDGAKVNAPSVGTGQGLIGLRERLALVGGQLEVGPAGPGHWRLTAWIPSEFGHQQEVGDSQHERTD